MIGINLNKPDTEELDTFMTTLEAFLLHNGESLDHLDVREKFEDLISDASDSLKSLKDSERDDRENSDDPHGYGDWRNDNPYAE